MSEPLPRQHAEATTVWGKAVEFACKAFAILGGILFLAEALMSVVSVLGRTFFSTPVPGDYELVQMMSAAGIAMCLPYCQLKRGHVFVDFFTLWAPDSLRRALDVLATLVLALISFLLAWRSFIGMQEMYEYGETSMVIALPIWWGYVPVAPSFVLLGITALMTLVQDARASEEKVVA